MLQGCLTDVLQPMISAAQQTSLSFASTPDPAASMAMLESLSVPVARLQVVMSGLAATHSHALLHRAPEVAAFASAMKVTHIYVACMLVCSCLQYRHALLDEKVVTPTAQTLLQQDRGWFWGLCYTVDMSWIHDHACWLQAALVLTVCPIQPRQT